MNTIALLLGALLLAAPAGADPLDEFTARVRTDLVEPFALDLGGLLGAASYFDGRTTGFPGLRLAAVGAFQSRPDKNDRALRDAGVDAIGLPRVEAAVALPLKFEVFARGLSVHGITFAGGGLRYGVFRSGLATKFIPNVGLSVEGDKATHDAFTAEHIGATAVASWDIPFVEPVVGAGGDWTRLSIDKAATAGVVGTKATASGSRFLAGLILKPMPFIRVQGLYQLLHGIGAGSAGLAVQF